MQIEFLDPARAEYDAAIAYYNEQKSGLGFDFEEEVKKCIQRIAEFPDAWSSLLSSAHQADDVAKLARPLPQ